MIIVSQDKKIRLNFDKVEAIEVGNPLEDNDGKFQILVSTTSDNQYQMAKYDTEERAIEILNEITTGHVGMELLKIPKITVYETISRERLIEFNCYEMPEE